MRKAAAAASTQIQSMAVSGEKRKKSLRPGMYITARVKPMEIAMDQSILLLLHKFLLNKEVNLYLLERILIYWQPTIVA